MSLCILSTATALPSTTVDQPQALRVARSLCGPDVPDKWLQAVYSQTGIDRRQVVFSQELVRDLVEGTRHSGSIFLPRADVEGGPTTAQRMREYTEQAPLLALRAARAALERSGLPARALTHLVTVSCTGFGAPGVDRVLLTQLELAPTVQRTHIGFMGCHGAINGLRVASAFAGADPAARILLCAVELCSLHYSYGRDPQALVANALFADGAAAVVGSGEAVADGWRVAATASCLLPDCAEAMSWTIGDHGFVMGLSRRVPALIAAQLRPWLEDWLRQQGTELTAVGSWAVHPGGPRILDAVECSLELPSSALATSRAVFAECGNMSSPTVLFILDRLRASNAPRPCVALAFGPGLVAEAALLR